MVIGIIGAGRLGTSIARLALKAGHAVLIANSRGPESLALQLSVLLPGAQAATTEEIASKSELVILAIPLRHYKNLARAMFDGKIVVDAMNYWAPVEGHVDEFAGEGFSSSEFIQDYFDRADVVKSLSHVAYNELESDSGTGRAILMAGDDSKAKAQVARFIASIGFAPVDAGPLSNGVLFQPDTTLFNTRFSAEQARYTERMTKKKATTHQVFKRIPAIKDQGARIELGRAHLLVALLAFALLLTLAMSLQPGYAPNHTLTITAIVLLGLVGVFSLAVAVTLYLKRK